MAVRGRSLWATNAACLVALFVLPALTLPAPAPRVSTPAPQTQQMSGRGGALGSDMLVILRQTLRASDIPRRDRPTREPIHLNTLALWSAAAPALFALALGVRNAYRWQREIIPFCGHGPPAVL